MRKWYPVILTALMIVVAVFAYSRLPDRVPTHWNQKGEITSYGSKWMVVITMPSLLLVLWAMLRVLPRIDPWRENYVKFQATYDLVVNCVLTIIALAEVAVLAAALGAPIAVDRVIRAGAGALFVIIGNVLPRARPNFWLGICTPWTLTNARVWERTNRAGGYLLVAAGVIAIISALIPINVSARTLGIAGAAAAILTVIYSYFVWRQETSK
jgi:uncharacterized membrane protein